MNRIGILSTHRLVPAVGSSAALRLARSGPVGLVLLGDPGEEVAPIPAPPPTPGAARLASALRALGHPAAAAWRLVRCRVTSPVEAAELLDLFAERDVPAILASSAERGESVDSLLSTCDRLVFVADEEIGESAGLFAARSEPSNAGSTVVIRLERVGAAVALAHAGIGAPPQWVGPLDEALADEAEGAVRRFDPRQSGQAIPLHLALTFAVAGVMFTSLGVAAAALGLEQRQANADVAALAGADALRTGRGTASAARIAVGVAAANGTRAQAEVPDGASPMPVRVRVVVTEPIKVGIGPAAISIPARRSAEAIVTSPIGLDVEPGPGDYQGPFAWRQGRPMRPDVASAFDRLEAAARAAGRPLTINSAWRSTSEQARLFAAHPDPKWVAPPGRSLHRLGTELDLGPPASWAWLAANAGRFGFLKRYAWEPWHFGFIRNPGSTSVGWGSGAETTGPGGGRRGSGVAVRGAVPGWVPGRFVPIIRWASIAHGISAAVLSAQLRVESGFDPGAVSRAGARGIAQLMPATARQLGADPFDPRSAIDAQARLMRQLLSRFGSVPLALAAYNAGPGAVARCGCVPPYPETRAYVSRIIAMLDGSAEPGTPPVRLVA